MDAPSPTALALVLPVKIRPLSSLIGSLLGLKSRCATCDEKSGLPTRLSSGTWTTCCPQCYEVFKLTEHATTTTARPSSIATLAQMDYTPSAAKAYITAGSDASINEKGRSAGIAFEVGLTILRNDNSMYTKVIASESFHIPVEDIDAAERIGVLVAMDWFRSNMVEIFEK